MPRPLLSFDRRHVPAPLACLLSLATLVVAPSCSDRAPLRVETRGSAEIVAVGDESFELEAEVEIALSSGTAESVALDSLCFVLDSRGFSQHVSVPFRVLEVGESSDDWPVELSGDPSEVVTRRLRVKAEGVNRNEWSHPCQLEERTLSMSVELIPSESDRLRGCWGGQPIEHRVTCSSCPGSVEALGFESSWQEEGFQYTQVPAVDLAGDVDGSVWAIVYDDQGSRKLARATGHHDLEQGWRFESDGIWGFQWHSLTAGQEPGVLYADIPSEPQYPDPLSVELPLGVLTAMRVNSRSAESTRWKTEIVTFMDNEFEPTPVIAIAQGRVFSRAKSPVGLFVDGELVDEGSPSGFYAVLLDERSGELVDHAWLDHPVVAARGLPDGGFVAIAGEASKPYAIVRFESDLSVTWVHTFPDEIAEGYSAYPEPFAADALGGSYWYAPSGSIHRVDADGELAWSVRPPNGATSLVSAPDGGILVGGRDGINSRIDPDGSVRADGSERRPSWCESQAQLLGEGGLEPAYLRVVELDYFVGRMRALD
jgi:hypothetical protein